MNIDWEIVGAFAVIIAMMFFAFRSGRENPVTTGKLQKDLHTTKNKLMVVAKELEEAATKADLEALRREIAGSATSDELAEVSEKVAVVCEKVVGLEKTSDSTAAGVRRIEGYFLDKGINGR